jgi:anhydro-N-acetylmuramic acid kinase
MPCWSTFPAAFPAHLATFWLPYPDDIRRRALDLQAAGPDEIHRSALLANALAGCYAEAVRQLLAGAAVDADCVAAIGCHGQTIRHQPAAGYTVQLNNPALLAELTGIAVVADFRSRDIAAGGQGAPLVPAFHAAVFGDPLRHRVILNIGGIANLTDLAPGRPVRGFDCGPGNLLLDAWIERHQGLRYDEGGTLGGAGAGASATVAAACWKTPSSPPARRRAAAATNSTRPGWSNHLAGSERPEDVQATLLELTAVSVAQAMGRWCGKPRRFSSAVAARAITRSWHACRNICRIAVSPAPTLWTSRQTGWRPWPLPGWRGVPCAANRETFPKSPAPAAREFSARSTRIVSTRRVPIRKKARGKHRPLAPSVQKVVPNQAENDDPQPQVDWAFGFLITNCEPSKPFGVVDFGTNQVLVAHRDRSAARRRSFPSRCRLRW